MTETKKEKDKFKIDPEEMARAGVHFGHRTSKINPKMQPYLSGVRNAVHIIDLEKTKEKLVQALDYMQQLVGEDKAILLVGTKVQVKNLVKTTAEECSLPYVNERWLGGTFTNLSAILKRVDYYKDLEGKKSSGELEKYTKKERAKFDQELKGLQTKFEGIKNMRQLPTAIFVCDMIKDRLAVKEAREKGVKVIGICDTNVNPSLADYMIPASDDAISSVKYILEKVKDVILKSKPKKKSVDESKDSS